MDTGITRQGTGTSEKPLVSYIMAARNFEQYIDESIGSVMAQDYPAIELVVVDDASTDSTTAKIRSWAERDARVKPIYNAAPVLPPKARNMAVQKSQGKYLAILDSDDVALPDRTRIQVEYLESHPDVAAVGSHAEIIDKTGKTLGIKRKSTSLPDIRFAMLLQSQFIHSSMMIRRCVFEEFGGYREEYMHAEDYDICSWMLERYPVTNIDRVLIKFRAQSGGVTTQSESQKIQRGSSLKITVRNCRPYMRLPDAEMLNLTDMLNNKKIPLLDSMRALRHYRRLALRYIQAHADLSSGERKNVLNMYAGRRKSILISYLKRMIGT